MRDDKTLLAAVENVFVQYKQETNCELAKDIILTWLEASARGAEAKFMEKYLSNFSLGDLKRVLELLREPETKEVKEEPVGKEKKLRRVVETKSRGTRKRS